MADGGFNPDLARGILTSQVGRQIDFEQPGMEHIVEQNVEPIQLEGTFAILDLVLSGTQRHCHKPLDAGLHHLCPNVLLPCVHRQVGRKRLGGPHLLATDDASGLSWRVHAAGI